MKGPCLLLNTLILGGVFLAATLFVRLLRPLRALKRILFGKKAYEFD